MSAAASLSDPSVRRSIEDEIERLISMLDLVDADPDLEPWLAGGAEVVGTDDREEDDCDLEEQHDTEPSEGDSCSWTDNPNVPQEGPHWHGHF